MLKQSKLKSNDLDIEIKDVIEKIIQENSLEILPIAPTSIRIDPFVQLLCQECINYGASFKCPPYTPCFSKTREIIAHYDFHYLVIQREDRNEFKKKLYNKGWSDRRVLHLTTKNWDVVSYWSFHKAMVRMKDVLESNDINTYVFGSGGGCRFCRSCEVHSKHACSKPEMALPSAEACGIDVYGTLKDLDIAIEVPPRRFFTRVSFIFSDNDLGIHTNIHRSVGRPRTNLGINDILSQIDEEIPGTFQEFLFPLHPQGSRTECSECSEQDRFMCSIKYLPDNELVEFLDNRAIVVLKFPSKKSLGRYLWRWQRWFQRLGFYDCLSFANEPCWLCNECSKKGCTLVNSKRQRKYGNQELWRCIKYLSIDMEIYRKDPTIGYLLFSIDIPKYNV